ncbi:hypothetical protein D3C74_350710 [compost metagenome]
MGHAVGTIESATGARVAFLGRFGEGVLATPSTVLQENDVLHVLMRSADAPTVERVLTHAPSLKEN